MLKKRSVYEQGWGCCYVSLMADLYLNERHCPHRRCSGRYVCVCVSICVWGRGGGIWLLKIRASV